MRHVPAVDRAVAIIDLVCRSGVELRVAAIATHLGIPRNTCYELIGTLVDADLLRMSADGLVTPGFKLFEWGGAYSSALDPIAEAVDVAKQIAVRADATVHVARLAGRFAVYLVKEEGTQHIRIGSAVGRQIPAHASGVGKILLASLRTTDRRRLLGAQPLEKLTPHTQTSVRALLAELNDIAAAGVAHDHEESTEDVSCVAAPVRDGRGAVIAGLSISSLSTRVVGERLTELEALCKEGADQLSRRFGWGESANVDGARSIGRAINW